MNKSERLMRDILRRGKDDFGVVSVKAEFEAEGTRMDELLRLVDIARSADLPLTVKIGGCEAVRDLLEAKQIGVKYIVAPMVETPYALQKYIAAKNMVYGIDEQEDMNFLFNLETKTGFANLPELLTTATAEKQIHGIVFGRVDFSGSLGLGREGIESRSVTNSILEVAKQCSINSLDLVLGGAISIDALPIVQEVAREKLTRFETRKVVFDGNFANKEDIKAGLLNAVHFELLWLTNKRDYYNQISREDSKRIDMLESRWKLLNTGIL
jgi:HpcH/HpaI aldolase/citrate lyase family